MPENQLRALQFMWMRDDGFLVHVIRSLNRMTGVQWREIISHMITLNSKPAAVYVTTYVYEIITTDYYGLTFHYRDRSDFNNFR